MQAYSIETVLTIDGKIQLEALPFSAGESVQIIILGHKTANNVGNSLSLKNSVLHYENPLAPVSLDDWSVLQ